MGLKLHSPSFPHIQCEEVLPHTDIFPRPFMKEEEKEGKHFPLTLHRLEQSNSWQQSQPKISLLFQMQKP